jgi:predicted ATPase
MITRIKINGFKNLREVDLRFSEFTCVAGPNGSGKSNLFDAIQFLSLSGSKTILEAALAIRGDGGIASSHEHIFSFEGERGKRQIDFYVEMIVPKDALDDLNFLTYELSIRERGAGGSSSALEIIKEQLSYHPWSDAAKHLHFRHSTKWRASLKQATGGGGRRDFFISTADCNGETVIQRHQDGGSSGKPIPALARNLPRTVLSTANASESPTALCAKRELESWRFLALESSSLRAPDSFNDPSMIDVHGRHMPAALNRLIEADGGDTAVAARLAGRLTELVENVRGIDLDRDPVRQAYSILVNDHSGNSIPARGLSDGTLRFLALAILEEDPMVTGVICLEEPENGIHPKRIPAIIALLRDIAMDPAEESGDDNPLRQIIINTHSPLVVAGVPDDSLIVVVDRTLQSEERLLQVPTFLSLPDTWRSKVDGLSLSRGLLLPYLNPIHRHTPRDEGKRRVADREDLQALLPHFEESFQ